MKIKVYSSKYVWVLAIISCITKSPYTQTNCQTFTIGDFQSTQSCSFEYENYEMTMQSFFQPTNYCGSSIPDEEFIALNATITKSIPCGSTIQINDNSACCAEVKLYKGNSLITTSGFPNPIFNEELLPIYTIEEDFIDEIFIQDIELGIFDGGFLNRSISFEICTPPIIVTHNKQKIDGTQEFVHEYDNSVEFDYFGVCADGSSNTSKFLFEFINATDCSIVYGLRIKEDPDSNNKDQYGFFSDGTLVNDKLEYSYNHPKYLPSNTISPFIEYTIEIYDINFSSLILDEFPLRIYRTPLIMIHGLWSDAGTFQKMDDSFVNSQKYNNTLTYRVNYPSSSSKSFSQLSHIIPRALDRLVDRLKEERIVAQKVDIVGHSMGGILTRLYLQSNGYQQNISRLITLNTPHSGSQLANLLLDPNYNNRATIGFILSLLGKETNEGALQDLQVNSDAILNELNGSNLNSNIVPSHAIITNTNPTQTTIGDWQITPSFSEATSIFDINFSQLFNDDHDLIVAKASQKGGLSTTSTYSAMDHMSVTSNPLVIDQTLLLLEEPINSTVFSVNGYDPPELQYSTPNLRKGVLHSDAASISINSPSQGDTFSQNTPFNIQVTGNSEIVEIIVILTHDNDFSYSSRVLNSTFNLLFPGDSITGPRQIIAMGKTSSGEILYDHKTIFVCADIINLNNQIIPTGDYFGSQIISNGTIEDESQVLFSIENSVVLNTNFSVQKGTTFSININACNNNP